MVFKWLAALLYDWCVAASLLFFYTALCLFANHNAAITPGTRWYQASLMFILIIYYLFSLKYGGQTIGMRAWRLVIIADKPGLTASQILLRLILIVPALLASLFYFQNPQTILYRWTKTRLMTMN